MIRLESATSTPRDPVRALVIGLGGAGCNLLDRIALDGFDKNQILAINTDIQSLTASVAGKKLQIGRTLTRGLGAGGDPDLGVEAASEAMGDISTLLADAKLVFLCAGLGGGTGSGAAPVVARLAREQGALVVSFVTMPFTFEGRRRLTQASRALELLGPESDAVVCFENDRLGETVSARAGIHEAFAAADQITSQSLRAIADLAGRPGLISIGLDDLFSALRGQEPRCLFGHGEADGSNAGRDALTRALKSPLLDSGQILSHCGNLLVNISGGPGLTLAQVQAVMEELGHFVKDRTQILFGTTVDARLGDRIAVTLISSPGEKVARTPQPAAHRPEPAAAVPVRPPTPEPEPEAVVPGEEIPAAEPDTDWTSEPEVSEEGGQTPPFVHSQPRIRATTNDPGDLSLSSNPRKTAPKQGDFQFEPVTRGRFEKSEPTIVEGEDLDIPTFLRKNMKIKN